MEYAYTADGVYSSTDGDGALWTMSRDGNGFWTIAIKPKTEISPHILYGNPFEEMCSDPSLLTPAFMQWEMDETRLHDLKKSNKTTYHLLQELRIQPYIDETLVPYTVLLDWGAVGGGTMIMTVLFDDDGAYVYEGEHGGNTYQIHAHDPAAGRWALWKVGTREDLMMAVSDPDMHTPLVPGAWYRTDTEECVEDMRLMKV